MGNNNYSAQGRGLLTRVLLVLILLLPHLLAQSVSNDTDDRDEAGKNKTRPYFPPGFSLNRTATELWRLDHFNPSTKLFNEFFCSEDPESAWIVEPDNGVDRFKCLIPKFWGFQRRRQEEGWITEGLTLDRVGGRVQTEIFFFNSSVFFNHFGTIKDNAFRELEWDALLIRNAGYHRDPITFGYMWDIFHSFVCWSYWIHFWAYLIGTVYTFYVVYYLTRFLELSYYLRGFCSVPLRKFIRYVIVTLETAKRDRYLWLAPPIYHGRRRRWRLFYPARNHYLEERPYKLAWRLPPNILNYADFFLVRSDYDRHDLEIYEIEVVEEMTQFFKVCPVAVSYFLKSQLKNKFDSYFHADFERFKSSSEDSDGSDDQVSSSTETESSSDVTSSSGSDGKPRHPHMTKKERKNRKKKKHAEDIMLERERQFFDKIQSKTRTPAHLLPENPFKIPPGTILTAKERAALRKKAEALLKKYEIDEPGPKKPHRTQTPNPTKKEVARVDRELRTLLPLVNQVVYPHLEEDNKSHSHKDDSNTIDWVEENEKMSNMSHKEQILRRTHLAEVMEKQRQERLQAHRDKKSQTKEQIKQAKRDDRDRRRLIAAQERAKRKGREYRSKEEKMRLYLWREMDIKFEVERIREARAAEKLPELDEEALWKTAENIVDRLGRLPSNVGLEAPMFGGEYRETITLTKEMLASRDKDFLATWQAEQDENNKESGAEGGALQAPRGQPNNDLIPSLHPHAQGTERTALGNGSAPEASRTDANNDPTSSLHPHVHW